MEKDQFKQQINSSILTAETDDSLGIINMENIRVFGDTSNSSKNTVNPKMTNERLMAERMKALSTLKTASLLKNYTADNKENNNQIQNYFHSNSVRSSNPVIESPSTHQSSLSISDFIIENTIHLETSSTNNITSSANQKVSFEPSEITGRSTCRDVDLLTMKCNELTVEQILASSCSENVRSLCDSMNESYDRDSFSLPRTADMSKNSKTSSLSSGMGTFSFSNAPKCSESVFCGESFTPAEMMDDKMKNDEKEWAQQFLPIPTNENSTWSNGFNSDSKVIENQNSIGSYFDRRCESLVNIVSKSRSPKKSRTPVALIDESIENENNESLTPKVDGKSYSRYDRSLSNTGDTTGNSYFSMSAIEKVINGFQTEDSDNSLVHRLMLTKKPRSCKNTYNVTEAITIENLKKNAKISCNSENFRPENQTHNNENVHSLNRNDIQLSDTVSFSDSVLNSTESKNFKMSENTINNIQDSSQISPIKIKIFGGSDADNESSYSSSVIKSTSRRVYTKSPNKTALTSKTPTPNSKHSKKKSRSPNSKASPNHKNNCSTQKFTNSLQLPNNILSGCNMTPEKARSEEDDNFLQPSNVKNITRSQTIPNTDHDTTLRPYVTLEQSNKNFDRSESPESSYNSPLSSPRSCLSSDLGSPKWNSGQSNLEMTTNSERRFLTNRSSPDFGKISLPTYGILTSRSASTMSLRSARCASQCSNSSEFNHRDGKKIPLKVTCYEMCWGSSKLRCYDKKSMQIKNTSTKRLILKVSVSGPGFQIIELTGNLITLQPQECRSIAMVFCPTVIGAAVGRLHFSSPNGNLAPYLEIPLYGYGGHTNISPQGILKGPEGSPFITMGDLSELSHPLVKTFKIYNKGPLFGFAALFIEPASLIAQLSARVEIEPNKMIMPPESTANIRVTFSPRRDDVRKITKRMANVMTIAHIKIVSGDEPTRQRIRNLIHRLTETELTQVSSATLNQVWLKFPNEKQCEDLQFIKENANSCMDLISNLRTHDVALTLNDMDTSQSTIMFNDADETVLFRTIISYKSTHNLEELKEVDDNYNQNKTSFSRSNKEEMWAVRPNKIDIDPIKWNGSGSFQIKSYYKDNQYFEVTCNFKHLFNFSPIEGNITPGAEVEIRYSFQNQRAAVMPHDIYFLIYIDSERLKIPVNIIEDNFPTQFK